MITPNLAVPTKNVKHIVKRVLSSLGYKVRRISDEVGQDPLYDLERLAGNGSLVIIDAGANIGQSIFSFHRIFREPVIHAFEPGRETFAELQQRTSGLPGLHLNNYGLGSQSGTLQFIRNSTCEMSSFLEPSVDCWGTVQERQDVTVKTLDEYCAEENVNSIDILKSDTQGFDLEVIKGAQRLLSRRAIHFIYMEIILCDMYKGLPSLDEIYSFLAEQGFALVSFYQFHYQPPRAAWTDALFVNPQWKG
jgi:FkbM family methyltransferase